MVTGGSGDGLEKLATVQVYTLSGPQEQLPNMTTGRYYHACAHYLDSQDRVVSIHYGTLGIIYTDIEIQPGI